MECYAESGGGEHREVVGSVAYGYGLFDVDILHLREQPEQFGFSASVDYIAQMPAGEFAVFDLQFVGVDIVKSETLFEVIAEILNPPESIAVL